MRRPMLLSQFQRSVLSSLGSFGLTIVIASQAHAQQVVSDGTLNTTVTRSGNAFTVLNGTAAGSNLFHSFREFSIPSGGSATFDLTHSPNTSTIFSRVTGNSASSIDGVLRVVGKADLFLLNPNGILFGKGARLDLNGSLIATTASAIAFGTQGQFSTTEASPLLTIQPSALWFGATPQPITVLGNSPGYTQTLGSLAPALWNVPIEKSLVLVGGNIDLIGASIGADRAQITLTGLANAGQVNLIQTGAYWSAQPAAAAPLANISLTQGAIVSSRRGQESQILLQGNTVALSNQSRLRVVTQDQTSGGTIDIRAAQVILSDRAFIGSDAFRSGAAGKVQIQASQSVEVNESLISSNTYGTSPIGGEIKIDTARLSVLNGSSIGTSSFNSGGAGSIQINASELIDVNGSGFPVSRLVPYNSSIESDVYTLQVVRQNLSFLNLPEVPSGNSGNVTINTAQLRVWDRGIINVKNEGTGNGGELSINANTIRLDRSGALSAETRSGEGGNITIQSQLLLIRDRAQVAATAKGTGNGGNITIRSPLIVGLDNGDIVASAVQGRGGNIQITTQAALGLQYRDRLTTASDITASSEFGVNGSVQINTIGVAPNSGLVELAGTLTDASQQIAQGCSTARSSSFIVTGRGGIPVNPLEEVSSDRTWVDLRLPGREAPREQAATAKLPVPTFQARTIAQASVLPTAFVEATSWYRNPQTGKVELVALRSAPPAQIATCT